MLTTLATLDWPFLTPRLTLRPLRPEDLDEVWRWRGLPEVCEWMSGPAETPAEFLASASDTLVAGMDGRLVAVAKLQRQDAWAQRGAAETAKGREAEIGWAVDPRVQGRGVGTELAGALVDLAFGGLGVRRVVAHCFADNTASWRVMEKLGMRREGHYVRESLHRTRGWLDGLTYALLADEWSSPMADGRPPQRS